MTTNSTKEPGITELQRLDSLGVNRISATLRASTSIREAARRLLVSHVALLRWLHKNNMSDTVDPEVRAMKLIECRKMRRAKLGAMEKWLQTHPNEVLPRSVKQSAALMGTSEDAVKSWLYRKRKAIQYAIQKLPDIRLMSGKLKDIHGENVELFNNLAYRFKIDHWALTISLLIVPEGETSPHIITFASVKVLTKAIGGLKKMSSRSIYYDNNLVNTIEAEH